MFKKKPPKLKTGDRTMSLALENYSPGTSSQHQHQHQHQAVGSVASGVTIDPSLLIDNNLIVPPPPMHGASSPIQEFRNPNIFYMESSNSSLNNHGEYAHAHAHHMPRKPNIRRSDTLDVYGPGMYEMRKANSFNSSEATAEEAVMSRRTNSMRHSAFPYEMADEIAPLPAPAPPILTEPSTNRRNCRMHKSFHERSRQHDVKKEKTIDAVKCHSLGDDGCDDIAIINKRRLSPKSFNSAESSLDNEVFHSRSNSHTKIETDSIEAIDASEVSATSPTTPSTGKKIATTAISHKHSSHSLDKPHHSFRRIARATQSFYLNPNQYDELRLQRSLHGTSVSAGKRMHSASMRAKPFRETLAETKKSKSFVAYPFAAPSDYELSPHRRASKVLSGDSVADVKKSPRLSSTMERKSSNFDGEDLDYDVIMRAYRQNRRKSSILSGGIGGSSKKKDSSKKKSIDGEMGLGDGNDDEDGDTESTRKRKRIVCIVVSVFLSLVFASVFVVVFTLTHSSMTQVSDHTKRVYTFAPGPGNRDMPIHHHNGNFIIIDMYMHIVKSKKR